MSDLRNPTRKRAMINALEKSLGIVSVAARSAKVDRSTHYEWMKLDDDYANEVRGIAEMAIDFAESKLHKQIEDGIPTSTIFYLKCKAKHRGYVERQEITGADGDALAVRHQLGAIGEMSAAQLKSILHD